MNRLSRVRPRSEPWPVVIFTAVLFIIAALELLALVYLSGVVA